MGLISWLLGWDNEDNDEERDYDYDSLSHDRPDLVDLDYLDPHDREEFKDIIDDYLDDE